MMVPLFLALVFFLYKTFCHLYLYSLELISKAEPLLSYLCHKLTNSTCWKKKRKGGKTQLAMRDTTKRQQILKGPLVVPDRVDLVRH